MVSPPFNISELVPADDDVVSQFPTTERTFRDTVESWLKVEHNVQGRHDKVSLDDQNADLSIAVDVVGIWNKDGVIRTRNGIGAVTRVLTDGISAITLDAVTLTGASVAPTQAAGNNTTLLATTAFVSTAFANTAFSARGYIDGNIASNGTDATNDINIGAGTMRDSTNTVMLVGATAMGKQLDANWAPGGTTGTPLGMRNSSAGIGNNWYYLFRVGKADGTVDVYADTTTVEATALTHLQAEPGGTDYIYARRFWAIVRVSNSIRLFKQTGDWCRWLSPTADIVDTSGTLTGGTMVTSTVTNGAPDAFITEVVGLGNITSTNNAVAAKLYVHSPDEADLGPSLVAAPGSNFVSTATGSTSYDAGGQLSVFTNATGQISYRGSAAASFRFYPQRYRDLRGKDA